LPIGQSAINQLQIDEKCPFSLSPIRSEVVQLLSAINVSFSDVIVKMPSLSLSLIQEYLENTQQNLSKNTFSLSQIYVGNNLLPAPLSSAEVSKSSETFQICSALPTLGHIVTPSTSSSSSSSSLHQNQNHQLHMAIFRFASISSIYCVKSVGG